MKRSKPVTSDTGQQPAASQGAWAEAASAPVGFQLHDLEECQEEGALEKPWRCRACKLERKDELKADFFQLECKPPVPVGRTAGSWGRSKKKQAALQQQWDKSKPGATTFPGMAILWVPLCAQGAQESGNMHRARFGMCKSNKSAQALQRRRISGEKS